MSFLSAQGSNANFHNTIVNDLTVKGKLTLLQDTSGSPIIDVPDNIIVQTITSIDGTNEIDLSTANDIKYNSTYHTFAGDIVMNGHNLDNVGQLNVAEINGVNGLVTIDSNNQLYLRGYGNLLNCKVQGSYIDWNNGSGLGQMNLICNQGGGTGGFSFYNVDNDSSGNVDPAMTNEIVNIDGTGAIKIYSATDSTSVSTGALIVDGGLGIAKQSHFGGVTTVTNTTDSTADNNGALIIAGGVGIEKRINVGGVATILNTTDSTAVGNGAMIIDGGMSVAKNCNIAGITEITNATDSTAVGNGALFVAGGLSVAKNTNVAGIAKITNATASTASTNGALVVAGGVGVAKDLYVSGNIHCSGTVSSADTNLYQEFHSVVVGGNSGTITGTINLNVSQGNTNYAVFSSIYDNLPGGSGGTYNSGDTSNALQTVIIHDITQTSFQYMIAKSTGNNVNLTVIFQVIFSSELNYNKGSN